MQRIPISPRGAAQVKTEENSGLVKTFGRNQEKIAPIPVPDIPIFQLIEEKEESKQSEQNKETIKRSRTVNEDLYSQGLYPLNETLKRIPE